MSMNTKKRKVSFEEYQKAMEEIHEKNKGFKSQNRQIFLFIIFLSIGILFYVLSDNSINLTIDKELRSTASKAFIPYIISVFTLYLIYFTVKRIKSLRCPKCRRFFPKGKLELFDSFQSTGVGYNSSGDAYFRPTGTTVYWTECKYCDHIIWITKGG